MPISFFGEMMISLIYVSSAARLYTEEELLEILEVSHKNNAKKQVTGLLAYLDGNIMQVLEGPEESVMEIYGKIEMDPRHHNLMVLLKEQITERQFPDWKMAFVNLRSEKINQDPRFSHFLEDSFLSEKYQTTPSMAMSMLISFKDALK